ncbi:ergosterol biosynthetic protein 28 [Monosporozyma unispora]|nr:ergosterol biosynthesis protein [Kazachstania unispora]
MLSIEQIIPFVQGRLQVLPEGYLPKWLLFISVVSIFNSIQTYISGLTLTRKVYSKKPEQTTKLSARTFGTWTFISCVIRLYGSLFLNEPHIYQLTMISYAVALFHFASELLIFKTCSFDAGFISPLIVASTSLIWMYNQVQYYTGSNWGF